MTAAATSLALEWPDSTNATGVSGYNLSLNGTLIEASSTSDFFFEGLTCGA